MQTPKKFWDGVHLPTLASDLGLVRQTVYHWRSTNAVPLHQVMAVENATGVHRSQIRPDFFNFHQPENAI